MEAQVTRSSPTPEEIAVAVGPLLVGVLITWFLMGVYTMQAYSYFMTYDDPSFIRALVIAISALEIAQWVLSTSDAWYYLIRTWGHLSDFMFIPREALSMVMLCAITSMIVQAFYAWRIWMIAYGSYFFRFVAVLVEGLSLVQGSSAIAASALVWTNATEGEITRRHLLYDIWLIGSLATDTLISLCMLWILFRARNNSRQSSKLMFNKLMINTIKTGSATAIIAAVTFFLFDRFRDQN